MPWIGQRWTGVGVRRCVARNPIRIVPLAFLVAIAVGTWLLMLPAARTGPGSAGLLTALFTATSAVCVLQAARITWGQMGR